MSRSSSPSAAAAGFPHRRRRRSTPRPAMEEAQGVPSRRGSHPRAPATGDPRHRPHRSSSPAAAMELARQRRWRRRSRWPGSCRHHVRVVCADGAGGHSLHQAWRDVGPPCRAGAVIIVTGAPASLAASVTLTTLVCVAMYDHVVVPAVQRRTKNPCRIGAGLLLQVVTMSTTAGVESQRLRHNEVLAGGGARAPAPLP
ncbi:hypothetical protein ACP4OV_027300 [Aristida adscensionis]